MSPYLAAARPRALTAELTFAGPSARLLDLYRVPTFLLPIYRAAGIRYGVPWETLAAINEVETDFGNDLSVSTAGAIGWMQFMPATWMRYGVDALNAGEADPYNPVDAIFSAARYLRDMGAAKNLPAAIYAYNHSAAYVESVMLRTKLISAYPKAVIAALTGIADGRMPLTGGHLAWGLSHPRTSPARSTAIRVLAVSPGKAAAVATGPHARLYADVRGGRNAAVVAVQYGRLTGLGSSRKLGRYVVLRDVGGDVFTYAGLGSVASSYVAASAPESSRSESHAPAGLGKVRLFARDRRLPLRRGVLVPEGTVLGHARVPTGARDGHLRFAIRPGGDRRDIDPRPILTSWAQLGAALHQPGAKSHIDPLDAEVPRPTQRPTTDRSSARRRHGPTLAWAGLSASGWDQLMTRLGTLSAPTVTIKRDNREVRLRDPR